MTDADTTTINGPSVGVTISGNNASRVFGIDDGASAALSRLTITEGSVSDNGGGIANFGTLELTDCTISGNTAASGAGGRSTSGRGSRHSPCVMSTRAW